MKTRFAGLFLVTTLLAAMVSGIQTATAETDQCPTIDGYQTIDICVPPSKPRAWITAVCVEEQHGMVRLRLKNNGDFMTESFWVTGAGADRVINVRPGRAKTRWVKVKPGETVRVLAHGLEHDYAAVRQRNCP